MPEIIFQGPDGRLEARYHSQRNPNAPIALLLQPDPRFGGTMNQKVIYHMHYAFHEIGFNVLRFNFRGVGKSQGEFEDGVGELSDAVAALDYLQGLNPGFRSCWVAGFGFGSWIGMQLLMRRPEITGFVSVAPPSGQYEFNFLAPCPTSGLIINGAADRIVPPENVAKLVADLQAQRGIEITHHIVAGASHFFEPGLEEMLDVTKDYVKKRLEETSR